MNRDDHAPFIKALCIAFLVGVLSLAGRGISSALSAEEPKGLENVLEKILLFDSGEENPHLRKAEKLLLALKNTADRSEMLQLMALALEAILEGLSEVLPYDPDNEQALKLQRFLLDISKEKGLAEMSDKIRPKYDALLTSSESGQCETTEQLAKEMLSSMPEFNYVRIVLGDCYFHNKDWNTALKHYAEAAEKDPNYARAYTRMAECYSHLGREKEALSHYIQSVILNPGSNALIESLKTYAYAHSYKVLLHRVPRMARVLFTPEGEMRIAIKAIPQMTKEAAASWLAFGLKKYLLYRDYFRQHPGEALTPSFTIEQQAFGSLLNIWEEFKSANPQIQDNDLDFLRQLRKESLLDAFIYVRYFRPEFDEFYFQWRQTHTWEVQALFEKYLVVVDPYQVKFYEGREFLADSRYEEAFQAFQEAAQGFIESEDPGIRKLLAESLTYMGRSARILGRTEDALFYHKAAREFMKKIAYQEGEAKVLNSLGITFVAMGRFDEALESFQESLRISRNRRDLGAEIAALTNMGDLHLAWGDLDNAYAVLQEAMKKSLNTREKSGLGTTYTNLGSVASAQGNYKQAMDFYEKGLLLAQAQRDVRLETTILSNIGMLLMNIGQTSKAKTYFEKALSNARQVKDKEAEATILSNLGALSYQIGDIRTAISYQFTSYYIVKEIKNRYREAISLINLGGLTSELQDKATALQYWKEALRIAHDLKHRDLESNLMNNLAASMEDEEERLKYFQRALNLTSRKELTPTQDNPYPTPKRGELLLPGDHVRVILSNKGSALYLLASKFRKNGDISQETKYLKSALDSLKLAVVLTEEMRQTIEQEKYKISFLGGRLAPYEYIIEVLLRLDELEKGKGWDREAFHYSERSKSRAFVDLLNESRAKKFAGIPEEALRKGKEYELKIGVLELELVKELDAARREKLQQQLDQLTRKYEEFKEELKAKYPKYAEMKYPEPVEIDDIQGLLDDGTAVIEYFVGGDFAAYWVITKKNVKVYRISKISEVLEKINSYRQMITDPNRPFGQESYRIGNELYSQLISAAEEDLKGIRQLIIIPDGELYKLPFQTLIMTFEDRKPHYLTQKFIISYIQSGSVLKYVKKYAKTKGHPAQILAMGRPIYGWQEVSEEKVHTTEEEAIQLAKRGEINADTYRLLDYYLGKRFLVDLPETEKEVDRIGEILKSKKYIFKKETATEDRIKEYSRNSILKDFKYIHFAAHGIMSDIAPALSAVALTRDKQEDGFLTVGEVYGLELDSDLVTLSACELGLGRREKGEGVIGLTRAFMYAGTPSVVVSLWKVADKSTMMLMEKFYSNLDNGMSKDRALQKAQLDLMKEIIRTESGKEYSGAHPFFWAPFVLYGAQL